MKKSLFILVLLFGFGLVLTAQTEVEEINPDTINGKQKMRHEDYLISDIFSDIWQQTPVGLKPASVNRGFNASILMDNPLGKSNFSVAFGVGLSFHNLYSNSILKRELDTLNRYTGNTEFIEIEDKYNFQKNKLTLMYIDIPVEFRFRTKSVTDNFKFAIGFKAGYNVKNYTKYAGDQLDGTLNQDGTAATIKTKDFNIQNIERIRYGITARIGYGKYNLTAYYALTPLMTKGKSKGDEMFPISVGIAFSPF
ncbi:MAG: outer membrane beta-barrel protein [Bacteroidales bacterium]|nr:outer membrane beta-barrel protein [Bacteroidales bacterium]